MRQRLQARIDMLIENIALRHQLMVYERGRTARRSLSGNDRLLWCFLARFFSNWRDTLDIVQPATVTRWRRVTCPPRTGPDTELENLCRSG